MKKILLSVLFMVFILIGPVFGADHAINLACSNQGDGTTWDCASTPGSVGAYKTLPASGTLVRGDTYYFSKGTIILSFYNLNDAVSGLSKITFKKAIDASHGSSTGWTTSLGNAQTIFSSSISDINYNGIFNIYNATGYYVFDGVYGSGSDVSSYGFKFVIGTMPPPQPIALFYGGNSTAVNYELYHCAFQGPYPNTDKCSQAIDGGGQYTLIQYCLFKGFDNAIHGFTFDLTVDNSWFTDTWGAGASECHGQQFSFNQDRLTISNSVFIDSGNPNGETAFISFNDARIPGEGADGWKIYNNVFINCQGGGGILTNSSSGSTYVTNLKFYSNTIVDGSGVLHLHYEPVDSNNWVRNNLYYNTSILLDHPWYVNIHHDYNYWDSTCTNKPTTEAHGQTETVAKTSIFNVPTNYDYSFKSTYSGVALNNGTTLGSPYNVDRIGVSRPQDAAYDMGAYEYSGADTTPPTLTSSTIPSAGNSVSLLHSEVVNFGAGGNAGWTVTMSGGASAMTYFSGSGSNTLVYSLARAICNIETGTNAYVQPGNGVEDGALNDLATIASAAVINNSTVDCTPPTIVNVTSSHANGTFTVGEVIAINVTFSEIVNSTGNVTVELETGATDRTCTFTVTSASSGSCNYTVQAGDTTSDLTVKSISGTIKDVALNDMVNFTPASNLAANKAIIIDTTAPTISGATPSGVQTCTTDPVNKTLDQTTDENSTCKWNTSDTTYALMANTFSATGGTAHHTQSLNFACNASYNRYTRCIDIVGNESSTTTISFSIGALEGGGPGPGSPIGSMVISPAAPGGLTISPSGTGSITLGP